MTKEQKEKLYNSMTAIDDKYIEEAAMENEEIQPESASVHIEASSGKAFGRTEKKTKLRLALRLGLGIAAGLAAAAAGIIFFTRIMPEGGKANETVWPTRHVLPASEDAASPSNATRDEIAYVKRWDEKDFNEKYSHLDYEGNVYFNHAVPVAAARKGRLLAEDMTAYGWDPYAEGEDQINRVPAKVYEIIGVSPKVGVAVEMEGPNCEACLSAFVLNPSGGDTGWDMTLGEFLTAWNLAEDLRIGTVYAYQDKDVWAQGYGTLCFDGADTAEVFRTLFKDTSPQRLEELPDGTERILYSIAVYDDVLGIENLALSVYKGGYLWTNLTGYASIFKISEADAQAFLDYVYASCEGYIPVYERDPDLPDEGIPENAPFETVVQSSEARTK